MLLSVVSCLHECNVSPDDLETTPFPPPHTPNAPQNTQEIEEHHIIYMHHYLFLAFITNVEYNENISVIISELSRMVLNNKNKENAIIQCCKTKCPLSYSHKKRKNLVTAPHDILSSPTLPFLLTLPTLHSSLPSQPSLPSTPPHPPLYPPFPPPLLTLPYSLHFTASPLGNLKKDSTPDPSHSMSPPPPSLLSRRSQSHLETNRASV